jgi:hypothetical protein
MTRWRGVLMLMCLAPAFASAQGAIGALVANEPVAAATASFRKGDARYIVLPICKEGGAVLPGSIGWDNTVVQKAMDSAWRPLACADIGDDPDLMKMYRLMTYAGKYNQQMFELNGRAAK